MNRVIMPALIIVTVFAARAYLHQMDEQFKQKHDANQRTNVLRLERRIHLADDADNAWFGSNDAKKAIALSQEYRNQYGDDVFPQSLLAQVYDATGEKKLAYQNYYLLMHNRGAGTERSPSALVRYGQLSEQFAHPLLAELAYREVIDGLHNEHRQPGYVPITPTSSHDIAKLRYDAELLAGAHSRSLPLIRQAVKQDPQNPVGHLYLSNALIETDHRSEAVPELDFVLQHGTDELQKIATQLKAN